MMTSQFFCSRAVRRLLLPVIVACASSLAAEESGVIRTLAGDRHPPGPFFADELGVDPTGIAHAPGVAIRFASGPAIYELRGDGSVALAFGTGVPASWAGDVDASAAAFERTGPVAVDDRSNLWIYDREQRRVFRLDVASNRVSLVGGNGEEGIGADGDDARTEPIGEVSSMVVAPDGSLLFAEASTFRIRRLTADGRISTIAGTTGIADREDPVIAETPAREFLLGEITAIDLEMPWTLWIADATRRDVYAFDIDREIVLGSAVASDAGGAEGIEDLPPAFAYPTAIAVDAQARALYVADRICKREGDDCETTSLERVLRVGIDDAIVTPFAGGGAPADGLGDGGPATAARLGRVADLGVAADGTLRIADRLNRRLRAIGDDGIIRTVAGNGSTRFYDRGDSLAEALFACPSDLAMSSGLVWIADTENDRVRVIDPVAETIRTAAGGSSSLDGLGDGGPAELARLARPRGIAIGADGALWIADTGHARVRRVTGRNIETVAGGGTMAPGNGPVDALAAALQDPTDVALGPAGAWIADRSAGRIYLLSNGELSVYAGGGALEPRDVAGTDARLGLPSSLAADATGNLYIADEGLGAVFEIDAGRVIRTIGTAIDPAGLALDFSGALRVVDRARHQVVALGGGGEWIPLVGSGVPGASGDGGPANLAELRRPAAALYSPDGSHIFIADKGNERIRVVDIIRLEFGLDPRRGSVNGGQLAHIRSSSPVAADKVGVFFGDNASPSVRAIDETTLEVVVPAGRFPPETVPAVVTLSPGLEFPLGDYVYLNDAPVAAAHPQSSGAGYVVRAGDGLRLDGSASTDRNSPLGDVLVTYEWDVGGDGLFETSGVTPRLTAAGLAALGIRDLGVYPVILRVADSAGARDEDVTTVELTTIEVVPRSGSINGGYPVVISGPGLAGAKAVRFDGRAASLAIIDDVTIEAIVPTGRIPAGAVTVAVELEETTIFLAEGFTYLNDPPVARAMPIANEDGYATRLGRGLVLDGSSSSDPNVPAGDAIAGYWWDLDRDGEPDRRGAKVFIEAIELESFGLARVGEHRVELTVEDRMGAEGSSEAVIRVRARAETFPNDDYADWEGDRDGDRLDDAIDARRDSESIDIVVVFEAGSDLAAIADRLAPLAAHPPRTFPLISAVCLAGIRVEDVKQVLATETTIFRIEEDVTLEATLDISAAVLRAAPSDVHSPSTAHDLGITGAGVNIAFLDSGVDDDHPALAGKFVAGFDAFSDDPATAGSASNPDDDMDFIGVFHGTHAAGIACGRSSTSLGIAPDAKLVDVKVLNRFGQGTSATLLAGLQWCMNNRTTAWSGQPTAHRGIDVLNLSLSSTTRTDGKDAISMAVDAATAAGLIVVASAGNSGAGASGFGAPGAADGAITVAALDDGGTIDRADDAIYPPANFGPRLDDGDGDPTDEMKPDVVAPGVAILAPTGSVAPAPPLSYSELSGSSAASAHVSGVAALLLDAGESLDPGAVRTALRITAEPIGTPDEPLLDPAWNATYGTGLVDAYGALPVDLGIRHGVWSASSFDDAATFVALDDVTSDVVALEGPFRLGGGRKPLGIAVGGDGGVWLACRKNASVTKLNSAGQVRFRSDLASLVGALQDVDLIGIAVDAAGDAWVSLEKTGSVARVRADGQVDTALYAAGTRPVAVAIDRTGHIWIANAGSDDVTKLDSSGAELAGSPYAAGAEPSALVCDRAGRVYVANRGSDDVTILAGDGSTIGTFAAGLRPVEITLDIAGRIWVANDFEPTLTRLDADGTNLTTITLAPSLRGLSVSGDGDIWASQYAAGIGSTLFRLASDGTQISSELVGYAPLNRGDATGFVFANSVDPDGDLDGDGWSNSEEIDGGANAMSRASQPIEINDVVPSVGSVNGGYRVRIEGRGALGASEVRFGAALASELTPVPGGVEVTAPSGAFPPHDVDIFITRAEGTSFLAPNAFSYENDDPVADADPDDPNDGYTVLVGDDLHLDGTASSEPNSALGDGIVLYEWNFDGNIVAGPQPIVSHADLSSFGMGAQGNYSVELAVEDSVGGRGTEIINVHVVDPNSPEFLRGDANQDLRVDLADGIFVLNWLFSGEREPNCRDSADVNTDGDVDIGDPIFLFLYLFAAGEAPSAPFPDCAAGVVDVGCDLSACFGVP